MFKKNHQNNKKKNFQILCCTHICYYFFFFQTKVLKFIGNLNTSDNNFRIKLK